MTPILRSQFARPPIFTRLTRARHIRTLILLPTLIFLPGTRLSGQGNLAVLFQGLSRVESRYTGGALSVVEHYGNGDTVTKSASVSDLDLESTTTGDIGSEPGRFYAQLPCKRETTCVSKDVPGCAIVPGCQTQQISYIEIACSTLNECMEFVQALKREQAPKPANPEHTRTQPNPGSIPPAATRTPNPQIGGQRLQQVPCRIFWHQ